MNIPDVFKFNEEVSADFDNHVRGQLPWYEITTNFVCHLACHYLRDNGSLLDVGASTGNITSKLGSIIKARNIVATSIDASEDMRAQFKGVGEFQVCNIEDYSLNKYDVIICMLSIMFVDPRKQKQVIESLKSALNVGGALVIVDKMNPSGGYSGLAISRMSLKSKIENGESSDDILKKELSLIGVQRPLKDSFFDGFSQFFQFGDFKGFLYESTA